MKVTLKNIQVNERLSDETFCYSATLYLDGINAGTVGNHGHGGCDEVHLLPGFDFAEIHKMIGESYPPLDMSKYNMPNSPADLESVCGDIITNFLVVRDVKRAAKKRIVAFDPASGEVKQFTYRGVSQITTALVETFKSKNPNLKILNGLGDEEIAEAIKAA